MTQAGTRSATPSAVPRFTRLEAVDPADVARDRGIDPMAYLPDMDVTDSPVLDELLARAAAFDFDAATEADVRAALAADRLSPEGFGALLSSAAEPLLEELAAAARRARRRWFGSTAYLFTPLYLANYCDNHCVYCGFNRDNDICRARLDRAGIVAELDAIAATGLEEILLLTGEDRARTDPFYIGEACKLAAERFRMVGVEVYPMNEDEYAYLHECGVDYVTVFQETYDPALYGKLHLAGRKRVFPYRANAQERAMRGGMRGAAFGALLGLDDAAYELLAAEMAAVCARCGIAFVAHAHVEAARRLGCAAVHLPLPLLRAQGRPDGFAWVGTNVHEADEVAEAEVLGADVLVASPVFAPSCKPASTARGLPFLRAVLDRAHAPVFALGGITDENERLIREAGAAGACRMADYARRRGVRQAAPCKYERSRG